jgi:hypothetical protein
MCRYVLVLLYLAITGNAFLVKAIYVIHLSMAMVYGSPAPPPCYLVLYARTVTAYISHPHSRGASGKGRI